MKKITHEIVGWQHIAIWDQTVPYIKKLKKQPPISCGKMGVFFLHLLYLRHASVSNYNLSLHDYFMHAFSQDLGLLKSKYLIKTYRVITLSGFLTILAFDIS